MKTFLAAGLSTALALSLAAPAAAYSLHPRNTLFTASGHTQLTKGSLVIQCISTFHGKIDSAGVGHVLSAAFTNGGTGGQFCSGIKAVGLPWTTKATAATYGYVYNVRVSASIFGTCGPTNLKGYLSNTGVFTFNGTLTPNCAVKGSLPTKPVITIVSP